GPYDSWGENDRHPTRDSFDVAMKGTFDMFGLEQNITFGGGYSQSVLKGTGSYAPTYGGLAYLGKIPGIPAGDPSVQYGFDVLNFDPYDPRYRPYFKQARDYWNE